MSGDETEKKAAPAKTSIMASLSGNWFLYDIPASKYNWNINNFILATTVNQLFFVSL